MVVVVVSETVDEGVGLVPHDGVGGRVLGPGVLGSGGPQHEMFSGKNKHKISKTLNFDLTYFFNDCILHDHLVSTLVLMNF